MQLKNSKKKRLKRTGAAVLAAAVCFCFTAVPAGELPGFASHAETAAAAQNQSSDTASGAATVKDGTYVPSSFIFTGGTGKVKITCTWVKKSGSETTAEVVFHSAFYTTMTADGKDYSSKVNESLGTSTFVVPVKVNEPTSVSAVTTRMGAPHAIEYTLNIGLKKGAKVYSSKNSGGSKSSKTENSSSKNTSSKKYFKNGVLRDGTYRVRAWTDQYMFNIQPYKGGTYAVLTVKNGKMKAKITLTGQGYDYLYLGSTAQAEKAAKSTWIRYSSHNNYYSYSVPVKKLNSKFLLAGHSKRENRWYQHKAAFYTSGMVRVSGGASVVPKGKNTIKRRSSTGEKSVQTVFHNNHKKDKVSESTADRSKSTAKVDSRAGRKDGVYTPSSFSWSGGSGRLKGITCSKITVTGGKAYATIVFESPYYDQLRADGRTFIRSGGGSGTSTFVIPVRLNANNRVVGRTTAMSQPHWIPYTLYIGLTGSGGKASSASQLTGGQKKLSKEAPAIAGLKSRSPVSVKHAELFKIFRYSKGITLIQVDMGKYAAARSTAEPKEKKTKIEESREELEQKEGKTQSERTEQLYKGKVINYLVVPEGASVPAGLDKSCIIIHTPKQGYTASQSALRYAGILNQSGRFCALGFNREKAYDLLPASQAETLKTRVRKDEVRFPGKWQDVDYRDLVEEQADLCILPSGSIPVKSAEGQVSGEKNSSAAGETVTAAEKHPVKHFFAVLIGVLPEKILPEGLRKFVETYAPPSHAASGTDQQSAETKKDAKSMYRQLDKTIQLFTAMKTPVLIDRSVREKNNLAEAEWIKVYGAVLGCGKEAQSWYDSYCRAQSE